MKYSMSRKLAAVLVAVIFTLSVSPLAYGQASSKPEIIISSETAVVSGPGVPIWNPYNAGEYGWATTNLPLAYVDGYTGVAVPILASGWYVDPSNLTLIVYLRQGRHLHMPPQLRTGLIPCGT